MFSILVTILHVIVAVALIVIVLFQHGKGATMGAAFGGSSQTLFGSRGPATALAKITTAMALLFMVTSITLSIISAQSRASSIIQETEAPTALPTELPDEAAPVEEPAGPGAEAPAEEGPLDEPAGPGGAGEASGG